MYTQNPSWQLDCHPPCLQRKYTEIIKYRSRESMASYKFFSCRFRRDVYLLYYLALFTPIMVRVLKAYTAVSLLNDASITPSATVTADINMEQIVTFKRIVFLKQSIGSTFIRQTELISGALWLWNLNSWVRGYMDALEELVRHWSHFVNPSQHSRFSQWDLWSVN